MVKLEAIVRDVISYLATHNNMVGLKKIAKILEEVSYTPRRIFEIR